MSKLICAFIACLLAVGASAAGDEQPVPFNQEFESVNVPPQGSVTPVRVGLYILNLVALNEVEQTFTCTGYLTETWTDSRLKFTPLPDGNRIRYYQKNAIWFPLLQFDNSAAPRQISSYLLRGDADGTLTYTEKFSVTLSSNMHLRAFPFDSQNLEIVVHPFTSQADSVILRADQAASGISTASYTPLPLWHTGTVSFRTVAERLEAGEATAHLIFRIQVRRNPEYYVFRIFLPLSLMVAVSWGVLWIPPNDLNSQLLISVTTVLTLVVFSVALSNILPPVPYLTFYDIFFLVAFFFILIAIGEPLVVHTIYNHRGREAAHRTRRLTRIVLPLLFPIASLTIGLIFLR
jgi:Neurotransmitter-gated ion-channel ligand binding domain